MSGNAHQIPLAPRLGAHSRALIVDGHVTARNILASHLRALGVGQIVQCGRSGEAMQNLEARDFEIVLCEHRLADGRLGQDLIDEVRRRGRLSLGTVVMMLSAEASYDVVAGVAESALDGFLIKPYSPGDLEDRLLRAFIRKESLKDIFDAVGAGEHAEALALCEARFNARGRHWTTAARVGAELAIRLERLTLASAMYEAVLADKAVPWAKLGIARTLCAADRLQDAVSTLENLLAAEPTYADAYDVLGKIYVEQGDYKAAMNAYRQASEITPSSVARAQKFGIVAHYAGEPALSQKALERAATLGAESPGFDHQALLLLALAHYRSADAAGLARYAELLAAAVAREAGAENPARRTRLQRFERMVRALGALLDDRREDAAADLAEVAAGLAAPAFDAEAAVNLLSLIATVAAAGMTLPRAADWVRGTAMRFCVSKHVTEVLVRACDAHPAHGQLVRAAHAEIGEIARAALGDGLGGRRLQAVERLLTSAEVTGNLKLVELAAATLKRYEEHLDQRVALQARCDAVRAAFAAGAPTPLLAEDPDRPAGGLALGPSAPPAAPPAAAVPEAPASDRADTAVADAT